MTPGGAGGSGDRKKWFVLGGIAAAVLLVIGAVVILGGGNDEAETRDRPRSERTDPDDTEPDDTEPDDTEPDDTVSSTVLIPTTPPIAVDTTVDPNAGGAAVPRTPEELAAGLLADTEVNAEFENAFVEVPVTPSTEQFCGIVAPVSPTTQALRGFTNSIGTAELYSGIDRYASAADAELIIKQDQEFTTLCPSFVETIAGIEYNVTLAPFGDVVGASLEGTFAAVAVVGFGTADPSQVLSGFIIEKLDGANIVSISGYRYGEVFDDVAIERFLALMVTAFAKAGSVR